MQLVLLAIVLWVWSAFNFITNWIGRLTVVDDVNQVIERLPLWAAWLFSTPAWVPALIAALLTIFLIWLALPGRTGEEPPARAAATAIQTSSAEGIHFRIENVAMLGALGVPIGESHVWVHGYVKNNSATHLIDCRWEISTNTATIVNSFNLYAGEEEERFLFELRVNNIDGSITGIRSTDSKPFESFPELLVVKFSLFSRELGYVEKVFGVRQAWYPSEHVIVTEDEDEIDSYFEDLAAEAAALEKEL
jgi:hypothetical protein